MIEKTGNIVLSLVLLASFTGFSINMHFCHEKLYDLAILSEAHSCCDDEDHSHNLTCDISLDSHNDNCDGDESAPMDCENRSIKIDSPDNFIISSFNFNDESEPLLLFLTSIDPVNLLILNENLERGYIPYSDIFPPGRETTLALLQKFRN